MSQRRSGFGPGFSKDVEAVLTSFHTGLIYADEARTNLRLAGMDLRLNAEPLQIEFDEPVEYDDDPEEEAVSE